MGFHGTRVWLLQALYMDTVVYGLPDRRELLWEIARGEGALGVWRLWTEGTGEEDNGSKDDAQEAGRGSPRHRGNEQSGRRK